MLEMRAKPRACPIGEAHPLLGYASLVSTRSPLIRVHIVQRIQSAMFNLDHKLSLTSGSLSDIRRLRNQLAVLHDCIISSKDLPSYQVSLLIAVSTYLEEISTRKNNRQCFIKPKPKTQWLLKRQTSEENVVLYQYPVARNSNPRILHSAKKQKSGWKGLKRLVSGKKSKKALNSLFDQHSVEETPATLVEMPMKKVISSDRFRQASRLIKAFTDRHNSSPHAIRVLQNFDSVIDELDESSDLLACLKPTVNQQWRPILNTMWVCLVFLVFLVVFSLKSIFEQHQVNPDHGLAWITMLVSPLLMIRLLPAFIFFQLIKEPSFLHNIKLLLVAVIALALLPTLVMLAVPLVMLVIVGLLEYGNDGFLIPGHLILLQSTFTIAVVAKLAGSEHHLNVITVVLLLGYLCPWISLVISILSFFDDKTCKNFAKEVAAFLYW